MTSRDHFRNLWQAGYRRLVPIIPPDANISPHSSVAKRPKSKGKAVGIKGFDGLWRGFDWLKHTTTEQDLDTWSAMGAGTGIRTGSGLVCIDVDTQNGELCVTIAAAIQKHFGSGPIRIGNAPKFLVLFATQDDIPYQRIEFNDGLRKPDGKPAAPRVEILSEGRQFVAYGIHPDTGRPYEWKSPPPSIGKLPKITASQVDAFFADLSSQLPAALPPIKEHSASPSERPAQELLRGDPALVREALEKLPNTSDLFPTYDDYIRVCAAVRASLPDDEALALDLFQEWAAKWEGGNDPEVVAADFRRTKPPYSIGARWLYDHADRYSGGQFSVAKLFFSTIDQEPDIPGASDIFAQADRNNAKIAEQDASIAWIDPREWEGAEPPPREWIVAGLVPAAEVTMLTGAGGVGKTLLAQLMATAICTGKPFLGQQTKQGRVLLFLCEDDETELHRRQRDINNSLFTTMADITANMRITSRKHKDNTLVTFDRQTNRIVRTPLWHSIMRAIEEWQPELVVIDTAADVYAGSEIERQQVRQFIQSGLGSMCASVGCSVLLLAHPSRDGEKTGEGTSGSTAWHASVRSRLYLRHAAKDGSGAYRVLETKKANYGPAGSVFTLQWVKGSFVVRTAANVQGAADGTGGQGGGGVPSTAEAIEAIVLQAVLALGDAQQATSLARNSSNYAPRIMRQRFPDLLGMYGLDQIEAVVEHMAMRKQIVMGVIGRGTDRHSIKGLCLGTEPEASEDIFD